MSGYIDLSYISKIQPRLQQFKKKRDYLSTLDVQFAEILKSLKLKQEHIFIELKMICFLNVIIVVLHTIWQIL